MNKKNLVSKLVKDVERLIKDKKIGKIAQGNLASNLFNDLDRANVSMKRLEVIGTVIDDIKKGNLNKYVKTKEYKKIVGEREKINVGKYVFEINSSIDEDLLYGHHLVRDIVHTALKKDIISFNKPLIVEWRQRGVRDKEIVYNQFKSMSSWWSRADSDWNVSPMNIIAYNSLSGLGKSLDEIDEDENLIIVYNAGTVEAKMIKQVYRGDGLCWAEPIKKYFYEKLENSKNESTKRTYKNINNKLDALMTKYNEGLPADSWNEVCEELKINCILLDPFGKEMCKYGGFDRKVSRKTFKFINSSFGHLDGVYFDTDEIINIETREELNKIALGGGLYKEDDNGVVCVRNLQGTYKLIDKDKEAIKMYMDEIKYFWISSESKEYNFIRKSICSNKNINIGLDWIEEDVDVLGEYTKKVKRYNLDGVKAMDLSRAYGRWYMSNYYMGLPTKMGNFRSVDMWINKDWISGRIGFFRCRFDGLGFWGKVGYKDDIVIGTPEILFLLDCGVKVYVNIGLWGNSSMDALMFDEDFVERKLYIKFIGCLDKIGYSENWKMKGSLEFSMILRAMGYDAYFNNDVIRIHKDVNDVKSYTHIASYIQMYSRLRVFERIRKMNYDDVMAIKTDCILYKGDYELFEGWREDKVKGCDNFGDMWGIDEDEYKIGKMWEGCDNKLIFVAGAGGFGKTTDTMNDKGYLDIVYTALCWDKVAETVNKYGCKGYSLAMMLGESCRSCVDEGIYPSVILVDEMTMINDGKIEKLSKLYWFSQIICIGDVNREGVPFQCCSNDWNINMNRYKYIYGSGIYSLKDYRAKDDKLKMIKEELRKMNEQFIKGGYISSNKYFDKRCNELIMKQIEYVKSVFTKGNIDDYDFMEDFIIVSTKKQIDEYNKMLEMPKYKMVRHSRNDVWKKMRGEDVMINGMYGHMEGNGMEMRNATTVHSVQGMTIEGRVFIDLRDIFDINQIYTAVSRGRYSDKIFVLY